MGSDKNIEDIEEVTVEVMFEMVLWLKWENGVCQGVRERPGRIDNR